jgi:FtsZ-binding cell division protein ZapB
MINLEQIRQLEAKINTAVDLISFLRDENRTLKKAVDSAHLKMQALETLVEDFKADQSEIEECIKRAIENLDQLEGDLSDSAAQSDTNAAPAAEPDVFVSDSPPDEPEEPTAALPEHPSEGATGELDIF